MNDKYKEYSPEDFDLEYPYTWEKRNKKYLEKRDDRDILIRDLSQIIQEPKEDNE